MVSSFAMFQRVTQIQGVLRISTPNYFITDIYRKLPLLHHLCYHVLLWRDTKNNNYEIPNDKNNIR